MARNSVKYLLKQELEKKAAYGQSKHEDKIRTNQERAEMKRQGKSYEERLQVNYMRDKIYSYQSMKTYQAQVEYFGDYLIAQGHKKISVEDSKGYIQDYIDHLQAEGKSPWTISTALAAVCKATGAIAHDYKHPPRTVSHIERGTLDRQHDKYNEQKCAEILAANRLLGMRRTALSRLTAKDIIERGDEVVVLSKGKGGRNNEQIFTQADEKAAVLALKAGKEPDERIFDRRDFANDADLHHMRQQRAVEVYNRIVEDMRLHPERREYYKQIVHDGFERRGRICKENLDNPYVVRGQNRQHQISEAREVSYDRCAVLAVSVMVLNHCRSDVTVQHYIQKG